MLLLITAAASYITFRSYSVYLDSIKKRTVAFILFTLFLAALTFIISTRTGRIIKQENLPAKMSGFIAKIETVEKKRYNSDLHFTCEFRPGLYVNGILTYTGRSVITHDSIIAVHKNISRIDAGKNSYLLKTYTQRNSFQGNR